VGRNFEASAASCNVLPWGLTIGGEELHNNHHTYPTSAKLSVKPYEFNIGWLYIRGLEMLGLATVRKTAPRLKLGAVTPVADDKTLEAIIANHYEVMADYARSLRRATLAEVRRLKSDGSTAGELADMRIARRWLHRDDDKIPNNVKAQLRKLVEVKDAEGLKSYMEGQQEVAKQLTERMKGDAEKVQALQQEFAQESQKLTESTVKQAQESAEQATETASKAVKEAAPKAVK